MTTASGSPHHGGSAALDPLDRVLNWVWGRNTMRLLFVLIAAGETVGWVAAAIAEILVCRYLQASAAETMNFLAWSGGILGVLIVATFAVCAPEMRRVASISADSSESQQRRAESVTDPILNRALAIMVLFVLPAHGVLFFKSFDVALPTAILAVIAVIELAVLFAWMALIAVPAVSRVIRYRVQSVTGRAVSVKTRWDIRSRMFLALAPPALSGSSVGMMMFVEPSVPPWDLLIRLLVMKAVIIAFLGVGSPLFTRSVTLPLRDLTAGTERLKRGDFATPVPELASDEFGVIARTLNEAMHGLAEREHLEVELRESRSRIVAASDESRRRIERDLHDGAQQYLVLMELKLGLLKRATDDRLKVLSLANELSGDLGRALTELRDLAHGLYPAVLETDGLPAALRDAAERSPRTASVYADGVGRLPSAVEAAVYFCCLEAMQNAAKHAGDGATLTVTLGSADDKLTFVVADDGVGYDAEALGVSHGLQNMQDRIGALGGTVTIDSAPGYGTTVSGWSPV